MKKLISIGVAVALLAMVVLPVAVAADECYTTPATYAKIPFAIVQSGFQLVGSILTSSGRSTLGLPTWINAVTHEQHWRVGRRSPWLVSRYAGVGRGSSGDNIGITC